MRELGITKLVELREQIAEARSSADRSSADRSDGGDQIGMRIAMSDVPSTSTTVLTLRVAEARVEDVGHAIARLAPADMQRLGARSGDVLKITGGTVAVGRAELADDGHEGMIQIDGTCRSNCSAGLAGAGNGRSYREAGCRRRPLVADVGRRSSRDYRPRANCRGSYRRSSYCNTAVRVPTFAKAINFQVVRTIPSGAGHYRHAHRYSCGGRRSDCIPRAVGFI